MVYFSALFSPTPKTEKLLPWLLIACTIQSKTLSALLAVGFPPPQCPSLMWHASLPRALGSSDTNPVPVFLMLWAPSSLHTYTFSVPSVPHLCPLLVITSTNQLCSPFPQHPVFPFFASIIEITHVRVIVQWLLLAPLHGSTLTSRTVFQSLCIYTSQHKIEA